MAKITDHRYSINEAFQQCFYVVPDYQREYVWTDREVQQLLEDINEELGGESQEYFIGTILVSPRDVANHFDIIDGQQRLTTFFLILCALKHLFLKKPQYQMLNGLISQSYANDEGDVITAHKLDPRYENASELMGKIAEINSDPVTTRNAIQASGITIFGSLENILNAYDTIYRYLKDNYPEESKLRKYWGYLANKVIFIQISTDISSALKIFETINERGVGLNPMDLLKNLLFTQVNKSDFTKLKERWKNITSPLEKNKEKPLRFLRYYLMANYRIENNRSDHVVREDEIYNWFVKKENRIICGYEKKPFEFVQHVCTNVDRFINYSNGLGNDGKSNLHMKNLKRLCGGAFSLHYVLLLAASNFPKSLFDHFVLQLESFLFYYIFTKTPTKELERNFSVWADNLRLVSSETDSIKQIKMYNEFLVDKFLKSVSGKEGELNDYLKRYSFYSMQLYRTRYLLAKLTQYVDMAYKGINTPGAIDEYTVLDIEHILPNTPSMELRKDFVEKNPGSDYDDYKMRLGNLTLLEKSINKVVSNDFFIKKSLEYKKCKYYLTSSISELVEIGHDTSVTRINKKLMSFSEWSAFSIDARQEILIGLAKEIWKIEEYE